MFNFRRCEAVAGDGDGGAAGDRDVPARCCCVQCPARREGKELGPQTSAIGFPVCPLSCPNEVVLSLESMLSRGSESINRSRYTALHPVSQVQIPIRVFLVLMQFLFSIPPLLSAGLVTVGITPVPVSAASKPHISTYECWRSVMSYS